MPSEFAELKQEEQRLIGDLRFVEDECERWAVQSVRVELTELEVDIGHLAPFSVEVLFVWKGSPRAILYCGTDIKRARAVRDLARQIIKDKFTLAKFNGGMHGLNSTEMSELMLALHDGVA